MSDGETEDWLEQEIRTQIRTVSDVRADLESGEDAGAKYEVKVVESIRHLDALADPLKDDKFSQPEEIDAVRDQPEERVKKARKLFAELVKLFHRKGVL